MTTRKLLLISSSRAANSGYLQPALTLLQAHFGAGEVLFIPYAGVSIDYDTYCDMVATALAPVGISIRGIHTYADPVQAVQQARAIAVGGGNTFRLLQQLYQQQLLEPIRAAVARGIPYAGWSAGANIAGLSIRTTNDMPIIEPPSFTALELVPFQLNPHYSDYQPPGFHGESRDQRLGEFMQLHPDTPILAIREGTALAINNEQMQLVGDSDGYVFIGGQKQPLLVNQSCSNWLISK
ncbi:MAG: Peptidase E [Pseudidiomarina mangrovi]|nr:MAG: Peptidase E [Pseudidiomarina mangrovi]